MTINISGGLAALSLLTNGNRFADFANATPAADSLAVRLAKAQFIAPVTTPPWKLPPTTAPVSQQLDAITRLPTIIDPGAARNNSAQHDIQASLTTYKALDRLRIVAETARSATTSTSDRVALNAVFSKGLDDLRTFLGQAPTDKITIAFNEPTRQANSVTLLASDGGKTVGKGVSAVRSDPIAGLTGSEKLSITLNKPTSSDTLLIDLSTTPQPPTLDSLSTAINAAVSAIPARDSTGALLLDSNGEVLPKWMSRFSVDKLTGSWGLTLTAPNITEQVSVQQVDAPDALIVATGLTTEGAVPGTQILRFNDPAGGLDKQTLGAIAATNRTASASAALTAAKPVTKGITLSPTTVAAPTTTQAVVTDATGSSYVVGTTSGDIGTNLSQGSTDLFLTKLDSEGGVVWQRSLGAQGTAQAAAVSLAPNGDIVVAGTVSGSFDGAGTDGDLLVTRFNAGGDEKFASVIHGAGSDIASAVAVAADGTIYLGGRGATGGGDAFLARLDGSGKLLERRSFDSGGSDSIKALAVGADGQLLAVLNQNGTSSLRQFAAGSLATDTGNVELGTADARAIAVAADGSIAVAGSTAAALTGAQVNSLGGERDGFVTRIDRNLSSAATTYVASAGDDQVDSVAFLSGGLYVGGRTTGTLDGARRGTVDGFVSRIDPGTGAIAAQRQFGQISATAAPVLVSAAAGGNSAIAALGLHRGLLNAASSENLIDQTSLRAGDEFSLRVAGGAALKVTIAADDTLSTLAARVSKLAGSKVTVSATKTGSGKVLRFQATAGYSIDLIAGAAGKDALKRLGIPVERLTVPPVTAKNAPKVTPGGQFGLDLVDGLNVGTAKDASLALARIKASIGTTQSAFRSLFWDAGKAALANGYASKPTAISAAQTAQLASYRTALARLTPAVDSTTNGYTGL